MPIAEGHTIVQVTAHARWKLKQLALDRQQPMYKVLEELIDAAGQESTNAKPANSARQTTPGLVLDRE